MKHIPLKRRVSIILFICLFFSTVSYAETTQDAIDNAKDQIHDLKEKKEDAQHRVETIEDKKEGLEEDLGSLNGQMKNIANSMNDLEIQISEKEAEIAQVKLDLSGAEQKSRQQYEDMKLRIQFMYENGMTSVLQMLLEAKSLAEFLNRAEYITEINNSDRRLLAEFQTIQAQIAEQKSGLEEHMRQLMVMRGDMQKKQDSVDQLIRTTQENIRQMNQDLSSAKSDVEDLEGKIAKMTAYEKQLEIQKAKEDAARLEIIKRQEEEDTSGVVYLPKDSDTYLLGAIIQCEAEGEPYEGKVAVGSVVLNRVRSSYFPGTVSGVIYQKGQFSPVASGRLAYRLETGVNDACLQAAKEVLGGNITTNCLYFRTNNGIVQGTVIGNHVFY